MQSTEARLQFLRRKYERAKEFHTKQIGTLATLEEAQAEAKVAEQQLKEAKLAMEIARLEVNHAEEVVENNVRYEARSTGSSSSGCSFPANTATDRIPGADSRAS